MSNAFQSVSESEEPSTILCGTFTLTGTLTLSSQETRFIQVPCLTACEEGLTLEQAKLALLNCSFQGPLVPVSGTPQGTDSSWLTDLAQMILQKIAQHDSQYQKGFVTLDPFSFATVTPATGSEANFQAALLHLWPSSQQLVYRMFPSCLDPIQIVIHPSSTESPAFNSFLAHRTEQERVMKQSRLEYESQKSQREEPSSNPVTAHENPKHEFTLLQVRKDMKILNQLLRHPKYANMRPSTSANPNFPPLPEGAEKPVCLLCHSPSSLSLDQCRSCQQELCVRCAIHFWATCSGNHRHDIRNNLYCQVCCRSAKAEDRENKNTPAVDRVLP